jgi:hypothetical protein
MQLHTLSGNQGWVENTSLGCWSWFDLMIYSPTEGTGRVDDFSTFKVDEETFGVKLGSDGLPLRWLSHPNIKYQAEPTAYAGSIFGPGHELWSHVSPGDRLVVMGCCRFPARACIGKDAYLKTWRYYDPESHLAGESPKRISRSAGRGRRGA